MRWRRWERWSVVEIEGRDPEIKIASRHFTQWGARLAADMAYSPASLAMVAYWNAMWPDEQIKSVRQEVTRAV